MPTPDGLGVGGEDEQLDEGEAERGMVVLPDDGGDKQDLAVGGQHQGSEQTSRLGAAATQPP